MPRALVAEVDFQTVVEEGEEVRFCASMHKCCATNPRVWFWLEAASEIFLTLRSNYVKRAVSI